MTFIYKWQKICNRYVQDLRIKIMSKKDIEEKELEVKPKKAAKPSKKDIEKALKEEVQKEKDKFLRLFAEFENYKKRTTKERIELYRSEEHTSELQSH